MTHFILRGIFSDIFLGLPLLILIWAIWRRAHNSPRLVTPLWRSYVGVVAIGLAGLSSLLWLISLVWARVIGGFPYYDPVLLRFYRWGFLTASAGLFVSFLGKGKLRWPACGLSALMTLLWFGAAMGE
jgi:hypothetical protein